MVMVGSPVLKTKVVERVGFALILTKSRLTVTKTCGIFI